MLNSPFKIVQSKTPTSLPCGTCHGDCCGAVPLFSRQLVQIVDYLRKLPRPEIERLKAQNRPAQDCRFLDIETYRCSVYPVRPTVCQLYGRVPEMVCKHVGAVVKPIPEYTVNDKVLVDPPETFVGYSTQFDWNKL